jgi:pyruvate,water dikinase
VEELVSLRKIIEEKGLFKQKDFVFWIMVEVPSTVFLIEDFLPFVDGVSIGSNDLTQLILGVDRDSQILAPVFDERDPSVLKAMEAVVKACNNHGKTSSICGQAPSVYPEISEALVDWGATSISVNPDAIDISRKIVAQAEQKKMLKLELFIKKGLSY